MVSPKKKKKTSQEVNVRRKVKIAQSCQLFATPWTIQSMEFSRGWVAFPFSRESNPGLQHCRLILYQLSRQGSPGLGFKLQFYHWLDVWPGVSSWSSASVPSFVELDCLAIGFVQEEMIFTKHSPNTGTGTRCELDQQNCISKQFSILLLSALHAFSIFKAKSFGTLF